MKSARGRRARRLAAEAEARRIEDHLPTHYGTDGGVFRCHICGPTMIEKALARGIVIDKAGNVYGELTLLFAGLRAIEAFVRKIIRR